MPLERNALTGASTQSLTSMQQGMIRALLRAPRSGVYIIQDVCEFAGPVHLPHLQQSWQIVAEAHPALRTRIVRVGATAHDAVIEEHPQWKWREIHTSDVDAFLLEDWQRGFDFDQGVPMRFALLRQSEQSSTLVWTVHHALVDGRSLLTVWRAWMEAYDCLCRSGPAVATPECEFPTALRVTKADEAATNPDRQGGVPSALRTAHVSKRAPASGASSMEAPPTPIAQDEARPYWQTTLAGTPQTTGFLYDRAWLPPDPDQPVHQKETLTFSAQRSAEITSFASHHGVTVNTLVLGAWALLLSRYSGRDDVIFGVTRTGRQRPRTGTDNRVGVFINTLPFRVAVPPDALPGPWLRQLRAQWVLQGTYGNTPLDKVVEWGELPVGQAPFDTVLVYDHEPPGDTLRQLGGTWLNRSLRRLQRTESPLTLVAYGRPVVRLEVVFDTRRFSPHTVAAMVRHLYNLLDGLVGPPDGPLGELRMVTGAEERWLLEEVNPARTPRRHVQCAHELFEEQARLRPENAALESRDSVLSYQELDRRANGIAWQLRERGIGVEDLVAVCLPRSPRTVAAVLGVLKSGAAFLPLDAGLPQQRLAEMVASAGVKLLIADPAFARDWPGPLPATLLDDLAGGPSDPLPNAVAAGNAAYAIFTSGSTGKPKAILVTHASLVNYVLAARRIFDLTDTDRRLQFASPGSDVFVAEVFNYLSSGATLVFGPERRQSSIQEFVRLLDDRRITITGLPSTWWREWVEAARGGLPVPRSLRAVIAGMERVDPGALLEWRRLTGTTLRWFNAYGPAETTCTSLIYEAGTSAWESPITPQAPNAQEAAPLVPVPERERRATRVSSTEPRMAPQAPNADEAALRTTTVREWSSAAPRTATGSERAPVSPASSTEPRMTPQAATRQEDAIGPSRDRQGAEAGRAPEPSTESTMAPQAAKAEEPAHPSPVPERERRATRVSSMGRAPVPNASSTGASFVPIGKPVDNTSCYVLDGAGRLVPAGVVGELYIAGDGVARGYVNAPTLTEERFLSDPFQAEPGSRMYRTGDLVFRLPDGNIVFLGRVDRQVKIRGHRIELEELEFVLGQHAGVQHCAVVLDGAEGREKLVAYFTPWGKPAPDGQSLRLHMARRLPSYMVPASFVELAEMPRGAGGKIDRQSLPPLGNQPPLVRQRRAETTEGTDELLAGLWGEALDMEAVDPAADFFELGGDSLSAVRLLTSIHHTLGYELSLSDLLDAPSPAAMVNRLVYGKPEIGPANGLPTPLFCSAAAIGLAPFRNLAARLGPRQPLVIIPHEDALAEQPEDGNADRLRRVPAMAAELCRAVQALRPQGPYLLGGYCLGGIVAFEAARRLLASGAEVRMVVLFDTPAPGYPKLVPARTHYWSRLRRAFLGETIRWKEIVAHAAMVGELLRRKARAVPVLRPAAFDVVHFLAGSEPTSTQVLEDPRLGWRDLCQGSFTVHTLAGGHLTMFKEPHVADLAARLSEVLGTVNTSDSLTPPIEPSLPPPAPSGSADDCPSTPRQAAAQQ
ncbi:AMP-binding protein [uncultured Paludibaculum sp.]|uniref:AMP-binding protein n=1 Tax=uncultured Paludibaculum sp. TaxID=1765020 RepID=UPI002AAC34E8|nr:AMP-binding protein [uncultured Paludibaculum sp.]